MSQKKDSLATHSSSQSRRQPSKSLSQKCIGLDSTILVENKGSQQVETNLGIDDAEVDGKRSKDSKNKKK